MTEYTIVAAALYGNKGAASMLVATLQLLGGDDAHFTLWSTYPDEDRRLNDHEALEIVDARPLRLALVTNPLAVLHRVAPWLRSLIGRLDPAVASLGRSDVVLDQGGITFSDGRERFLPFNVATILPALVMGVPVVKCAQALGPFDHRLNRVVARSVLPRVAAIVARGNRTAEHLEGLGLDNFVEGTDLAFALEVPDLDRRRDADGGATVRPRVGLCPSEVVRRQVEAATGDADRYAVALAELVSELIAQGCEVTLVPHSVRLDAGRHNNDLPLCRDVALRVDHPDLILVEAELGPIELRQLIGGLDLLVTSRFHGMISALASGVPPVVLGWGHKYQEVLREFSLEEWGISVGDLAEGSADLLDLVNRALAARPVSGERIAEALPAVVARSREHRSIIRGAAGAA